MFDDDYVSSLEEILPQLNGWLSGGKNIKRLFDRHIAAYIAFHANNSRISNIDRSDVAKFNPRSLSSSSCLILSSREI